VAGEVGGAEGDGAEGEGDAGGRTAAASEARRAAQARVEADELLARQMQMAYDQEAMQVSFAVLAGTPCLSPGRLLILRAKGMGVLQSPPANCVLLALEEYRTLF